MVDWQWKKLRSGRGVKPHPGAQVLVAGDDQRGLCGERGGEHVVIVRVAADGRGQRRLDQLEDLHVIGSSSVLASRMRAPKVSGVGVLAMSPSSSEAMGVSIGSVLAVTGVCMVAACTV